MHAPLRLALVTHKLVKGDGQGRVNYELARAAAAAGHEIHLIASDVAPELSAMPGVSWTKVSHGPLPTALLKNAWFAMATGHILRRARRAADLVIVNGAVTMGDSDINVVHFVHGGWLASRYYDPGKGFRGLYQRLYTWLNTHLERRAFDRAARLVAVSDRVAQELRSIGVSPAKLMVIPNGVDTAQFAPGPSDRKRLGLPNNGTLALFVGDIKSYRKNLDSVLAAIRDVPDLKLIVVGDTTDSPFPQLARALGVLDRVIFLGFRRDVDEIMRACDIAVFPSRYEACSLVILETLASGLPIIVAETAGGSELIEDGAGIKIANPDDVAAIRAHLHMLVTQPQLRAQIGKAARENALKLTWKAMGERYLGLFDEMASKKRAPASAGDA